MALTVSSSAVPAETGDMVRGNNVEKRAFVPRVYQRNVDIEGSLVQPCIADINRRQGVLHPVSSLVEERVSFSGDLCYTLE